MRLGRALALAALATMPAACRRAPPPEPAAAAPAATAAPAAPAQAVAPAPPASPAPARAPAPAAAPAASELGVVPVPVTPAAAPAKAAADAQEAEAAEDGTLYSWEDASGGLHFGTAAQVPRGARHVREASGAVSVVSPEPIEGLSHTDAPAAPPPAAAKQPPAPKEPGDEPERDADGLPIPGTMKETAHTRAVRAATGVTLDPASVERAREKQNREMKCRVVDGVTICG